MRLAVCLFMVSLASSLPQDRKEPRAFSIFNVVTFPNNECNTQMGTMRGLCLTLEECNGRIGGTKSGNCASGFGVCCLTMIDQTDTTTVTTNTTYIINEGHPTAITPAAGAAGVSHTFQLNGGANIKMIRLDFETGITDQPVAGTGLCTNDIITITPGAGVSGLFNGVCGILTGQHLYVDHGSGTPTLQIQYNQNAATTNTRSWKIFVRFLEDGNPSLPPSTRCLQYFTGRSNVITSLNHITRTNAVGVIIGNTDYRVCIRMEQGMRCIAYNEARIAPALPDAFNLADPDTAGANLGTDCSSDYLQIGPNRHCGAALSNTMAQTIGTTIYDNGPWVNVFTTNANRVANSAFEVRYVQQATACP